MKNFTSLSREDLVRHKGHKRVKFLWFTVKLKTAFYSCKQDIKWEIGTKGTKNYLIVKKGTEFDVSAPLLLRWAVNRHSVNNLFAAALHDEALNKEYHATIASGIFMRSLRARGSSRFKSWVFFFSTLIWTA